MRRLPIGSLLIEGEYLTQEQLDQALEVHSSNGKKLGEVCVELGFISEEDLMSVLEAKLKVEYEDINHYEIDPKAVRAIPEETARKLGVIAIDFMDKYLIVATNDPMNFLMVDDLRITTGFQIKTVLATKQAISVALDTFYPKEAEEDNTQVDEVLDNVNEQFQVEETVEEFDIPEEELVGEAPIVKLVNSMIQQAIDLNASDIHIEPSKFQTTVRLRIDGELQQQMQINVAAHQSIVARLKIMSEMDIAERRIPQDGRIEFTGNNGQKTDIRVSSIPTVMGEKMVLRLMGLMGLLKLDDIGYSESNIALLREILQSSYGMVLVCGPTGSGKTTTVYSVLDELSKPHLNTVTIEDPVEYFFEGITQVNVNNKKGMTFASGLRSILRQDPDVIMVGEIRDAETAEIATRSAITGHLVISTLHTNDAVSAVSRLTNMGVEPYLVSAAVIGIVSQRLVKKLCPHCKEKTIMNEKEMSLLGLNMPLFVYRATGCEECNQTGYKGRITIQEILKISPEIRKKIEQNASADELRALARQQGMSSLEDNCFELVKTGDVSVEELIRATFSI